MISVARAIIAFTALYAVAVSVNGSARVATWQPAKSAPIPLRNIVATDVRGLYVASDGTCYTYSSRGRVDIYRPRRQPVTALTEAVLADGGAISGNSKYVFITCRDRSGATNGILRLTLDGKPAPYEVPGPDSTSTKRVFLPVGQARISSIAAGEGALFIPSTDENIVRVYNPDTMAPMGWFDVPHPGHAAVDASGQLWVEQHDAVLNNTTLVCFDPSGIRQPHAITLQAGTKVQALTADPEHNLLIVADNGPDQNIKVYDLGKLVGTPTTALRTIGRARGMYAKRAGQADAVKLNGPCGLGVDDTGYLYVASCDAGLDRPQSEPDAWHDGAALKCFSLATGRFRWKAISVITDNGADFDPQIATDIYTADRHLLYDYSKQGYAWSYNGYTLDRFRFPDDPRAVFAGSPERVWVRHINKAPYLFVAGTSGNFLAVYRFNKGGADGEIAIPAALIAGLPGGDASWPPAKHTAGDANPPLTWRIATDGNGNGHFEPAEFAPLNGVDLRGQLLAIDKQGAIWISHNTSLTRIAVSQFDKMGVPHYADPVNFDLAPLAAITDTYSLVYDPGADTLFLAATCSGAASIMCIDNVMKPSRSVRWSVPLPAALDPAHHAFIARVTAGGQILLFAAEKPAALASETESAGPVRLLAMDAHNGRLLRPIEVSPRLPGGAGELSALRLVRTRLGEFAVLDARVPEQLTLYRWPTSSLGVPARSARGVSVKRK